MLIGRITKERRPWWSADCEIIGAFTQGSSRKDACAMLADCIETKIDRRGFKAKVIEIGTEGPNVFSVLIDSDEPALLAAEVLKYQRAKRRLSLADVAEKLGVSSRNAYASYEQGRTEPSLSKFRQLLAVVAPELALTVGPRSHAPRKATTRR